MSRGWTVDDNGWRSRALCGSAQDPDTFFPKGRPSEQSRGFCPSCPVRQECLEFALASPWPPFGIWGGLTSGELQPLWAQRHDHLSRQTEVQQLLGLG